MMRPTGTIIAPPTPCRVREITSCRTLTERAHVSELSVKMQIATMKTRLAPKRSAAHPLIGTKTATARR